MIQTIYQKWGFFFIHHAHTLFYLTVFTEELWEVKAAESEALVVWKQKVRLALINVFVMWRFFFFFPYGWQDLHRLRHAGAPAKPLWTHVLSDAFCWFYSQHMPQREQGSSNCRITLRANNCLKQSVQTNCCWVFWGRPADGRALQCFAAEKNTDSAWNWLIWSTLFF